MRGTVCGNFALLTMPILAVSEDTIYRARSFAEMRGLIRGGLEETAMDEILASAELGPNHSLHVATLSRQTLINAGAAHLGLEGYFVFEANNSPGSSGITVLGKAISFEAALRLADVISPRIMPSL
jgi:hypothetical protein